MDCDEAARRCSSSPATGPCWSCREAVRSPTPCAHSTRRSASATTSRTRWRCGRWISSACCWRRCCPDAELLDRLVAPRALGLLAAAPAFAGRPEIPESWEVTSDSLAVLAAGAIGAEEAILLKPVDGRGGRRVPAPRPSAAPGLRSTVRSPGRTSASVDASDPWLTIGRLGDAADIYVSFSAKVLELGHRGRDQLARRARPHGRRRDRRRSARRPRRRPRDPARPGRSCPATREASRRPRACASMRSASSALRQPAVEAAAVLDERVDERAGDPGPLDQQPAATRARAPADRARRRPRTRRRSRATRCPTASATALISATAPSISRTPRSPTLTNRAPHAAAPRAASAAVWGRPAGHRSATLTGAAPPTAAHHLGQDARRRRTERTLARILDVDDVGAAGERARRASSAETTLTSSLTPRPPRAVPRD